MEKEIEKINISNNKIHIKIIKRFNKQKNPNLKYFSFFFLSIFFYICSQHEKNEENTKPMFYYSNYSLVSSIFTSLLIFNTIQQNINFIYLIVLIIIDWIIYLLYRNKLSDTNWYITINIIKNSLFLTAIFEIFIFLKKNRKNKVIICVLFILLELLIPFYFQLERDNFMFFSQPTKFDLISSNSTNKTQEFINQYLNQSEKEILEKEDEEVKEKEKNVLEYSRTCKNWDEGLLNIKIKDDPKKDSCKMRRPENCIIETLNINKSNKMTCNNRANSRNAISRFISNWIRAAYYDTTKMNFKYQSFVGHFHLKVLKNFINVESNNNLHEVIVDFKNINGKIDMNVYPKKDLIESRKEISKENKVKCENIVFIFIDSISRNHFYRKLPKTTKLIESYLHNNSNKKKGFKSFQFLKYSNFGGSTRMNVMPMFYGSSEKSDSGISINKYLKNKGYIIGGSENLCHRELFDLYQKENKKIEFSSFDHENFALFCDPNYIPLNNKNEYEIGIYSTKRRCLYGKDTFEYVFNYGNLFLNAYQKERKYIRLGFIDGHEPTLEVIKYMDDSLYNFINNFINNYYNTSSAIFIVSDHGENMQQNEATFEKGEDFQFEKTTGAFFLFLSDKVKYDIESFKHNEQVFLTPYDIHSTLIDIIGEDKNRTNDKGTSLFEFIDGLKRNCDNYDEDFRNKTKYCSCINFEDKS